MNSTELLADIKRKAQIETNNSTLTDLNLLDMATKELQTVITPKILSVREGYLVSYTDFTLSSGRSYRIPSKATGNKLTQLEYISSDGSARDIPFKPLRDHAFMEGFFVRANTVILSTYAPQSGTLRMHYAIRPGALTESGIVVTVTNSTTLTFASIHSLVAGSLFSTQRPDSPYEYSATDLVVLTAPTTSTVTVASTSDVNTSDIATNQPAGSPTRKSYIPQIPEELHDWLSYRTSMRVLEHLGHSDLLALKAEKLKDLEKDVLALISPRVDTAEKSCGNFELLGLQ